MRAGLSASDVRGGGPAGESGAAGGVKAGSPAEAPAGSPAPAAVRAAGEGVWGLGIYPLEVTPLGRRKARISKHAASQHFDCSPR